MAITHKERKRKKRKRERQTDPVRKKNKETNMVLLRKLERRKEKKIFIAKKKLIYKKVAFF